MAIQTDNANEIAVQTDEVQQTTAVEVVEIQNEEDNNEEENQ